MTTAGRGDPYWYEWFVGLIEVVELLDPGSDIKTVSFQAEGTKGWDDVIVTLKNGDRRCYQVKHTRAQDTLTFGDLIERDESGKSLLQSLFEAWLEARLFDGAAECILYTNRDAGKRWSTTSSGVRRPPLLDFYSWLKTSVATAKSLRDIRPNSDMQEAWKDWKEQLVGGNAKRRLQFLQAINILVKQDDLDGLEARLRIRLGQVFGITFQQTSPLFDSMCRALRKWTTGQPGVTAEGLCSDLAVIPAARDLAPAPPPPAPFFQTRVPVADELEQLLKSDNAEPVLFIVAEPGAGKTSVISWLENRRIDRPFAGIIGARFYCFEPIRPDEPVIAPDASRVSASELWLSLLAQLRSGLDGRLRELNVPLRNDILSWESARTHVLRLADHVGTERGTKFVLVIDGIDHAARAAQTLPQQTADFFRSLPGPDELASKAIRLLIAGQPPEYFRNQYPQWLIGTHPHVRRIELPRLATTDVRDLFLATPQSPLSEQPDEVVRLVEDHAEGNTLATIFAIAEAESSSTLEVLEQRLRERRLGDGLENYYTQIWNHSLQVAGELTVGLDLCLAGTISLARRAVTSELFATAFADWDKPDSWWRTVLQSLGPVITEADGGFRVRHNDVRVFLAARFAGGLQSQQQSVASRLSNYYLLPTGDRLSAHLQLFDLLRLASRTAEVAEVFTTDWVIEAGMLSIESEQLQNEAVVAIRELPRRRCWPLVVTVACAIQTLDRLLDARENSERTAATRVNLPPFLPSEARVLPMEQWETKDIQAMMFDAVALFEADEPARALALLHRWLDGLTLGQLATRLADSQCRPHTREENGFDEVFRSTFRHFGLLCGSLELRYPFGNCRSRVQVQARIAFESGYVRAVVDKSQATTVDDLFDQYFPRYIASWEEALKHLVKQRRWALVRSVLGNLTKVREKLDPLLCVNATWWAIFSGAYLDNAIWLVPLEEPHFGLKASFSSSNTLEAESQRLAAALNIARSLGWKRMDLDPGDIAEQVFQSLPIREFERDTGPQLVLLFRSAALLGRLSAAEERGGLAEVRQHVSPEMVSQILSALWGDFTFKATRFRHRIPAAELAKELSIFCGKLGGTHDVAAHTAATSIAAEFPIDYRKEGLWSTIRRAGNNELLRRWLSYWLHDDGEAWHLSRDEIHSTVEPLISLAEEIGETELARTAQERLKWLLFGYRGRKEYGLSDVLDWFHEATRDHPEIWRNVGWKLWCICKEADLQGADNRLEWDVLIAISSAAMRCGAEDWWRLVSTTLSDAHKQGWPDEIRILLVRGAEAAVEYPELRNSAALLIIWCLAISFSYWTNGGDNGALKDFHDAILESQESDEQRETLRSQLSTICQRQFADTVIADDTSYGRQNDVVPPAAVSLADILDQISRSQLANITEVAPVVKQVCDENHANRAEIVSQVLSALGSLSDYSSDWSYVETWDKASVSTIAQLATDSELWCVVESLSRDVERATSWINGSEHNLLLVAHARACVRGFNAVAEGLSAQVEMHAKWAFGKRVDNDHNWPALPAAEQNMNWREVALRLTSILFESNSAEVIAATLEGIHALVALDDSLIPALFSRLQSDWSRRWLLNAAESWATLHTSSMSSMREELVNILRTRGLDERLRAWIVLCRLTDLAGESRVEFPIPSVPPLLPSHPQSHGILSTSPTRVGRQTLVDRYHATSSILERLSHCGFDFAELDGVIADRLANLPSQSGRDGPHRRNAFKCTPLDAEVAVGDAILAVMSTKWLEQKDIPLIAQGFLSNEDPWLERNPPSPVKTSSEWPGSEFGDKSLTATEVRNSLIAVAMTVDVPQDWITFAAKVVDCTWKQDFSLWLWWEELSNTMLIGRSGRATCLSGRTFVWWLGDFFEPPTVDDRFVSGYFVGGSQRLCYCTLEIQPSRAWRDRLGWNPDSVNPLVWRKDGAVVARYERLHGPLRENVHGPSYRQPIVERWLITVEAFRSVEESFGALRRKDDFEVHPFEE